MNLVKLSRYWVFQLAGWGIVCLCQYLFCLHVRFPDRQSWGSLFFGRLGIFVTLGLIATHVMRFVIIRLNILQKCFDKQIAQFLLLTLFFSIIVSFFYSRLLHQFDLMNSNEGAISETNFVLLVLKGSFDAFIYFVYLEPYLLYVPLRK